MIWAYSNTPQDQWDFDEPGQNFVADLEIDGETVRALFKSGRNGFFYVHDAATGELLVEPYPYGDVNWASGVDMETGVPIWNYDAVVYTGIQTDIAICPFIGGNNWYNDAYSPQTGLVYFQAENTCATFKSTEAEYTPGENYLLMEMGTAEVGPSGWQGELQAWNCTCQQKRPTRPPCTTSRTTRSSSTSSSATVPGKCSSRRTAPSSTCPPRSAAP